MNNTNPKYEGRSLESLKSSLYAVNLRLEKLRIEAALALGILPLPEGKPFWVADEIDWTNPEVSDLSRTYFDLLDKSHDLSREIEYREAVLSDNIPYYEAKNKAYAFMNTNFTNLDEEVEFFKKNNLLRGMSSLAEEICKNPNYLEEVIL